MIDPSLNLHKAVYAALIASEVADEKVFHTVPPKMPLPFVHIGDNIIESEYDCGPHSRCSVYVSAFASTKPEAMQMAGLIREALDWDLTVEGFHVAEAYLVDSRFITEPNGMTSHVLLEFEYLLIPTEE